MKNRQTYCQSAFLPVYLPTCLPLFYMSVLLHTLTQTTLYTDSMKTLGGCMYVWGKGYLIFYSNFIIYFIQSLLYLLQKLYIFYSNCIIYFTQIVLYILLKLDYIFYSNLIIYFTQTLLYILLKLYYIFYSNFIVRNHVTAMSVSNFTIVEHYLYCILFFIYIVHTTRFKFKGCTRYANLFLSIRLSDLH